MTFNLTIVFALLWLHLLHYVQTSADDQKTATLGEDEEADQQELQHSRCELSFQKIPGLSPLVKTDQNGRSCRGEIKLPFCRGLCRSRESGTHSFPHREQEAYFCGIVTDNATLKNVTLEDCDEGAEDEARFVQISTATECKCTKMP